MSCAAQTTPMEHRMASQGQIVFVNPGLIDTLGITAFGMSAKVKDNAIGEFGTGLKHAIAMILRMGEEISIWRGDSKLDFDSEPVQMRDKSFDMVRMNGLRLAYSLDLGRSWAPWMAFREIWCNCVDEGGMAYWSDEEYQPLPDHTAIVVKGAKFAELFAQRDKYILSTTPLCEIGNGIEIHPGPSSTVFYKGVAVYHFEEKMRSIFTYNITSHIDLTEDRTLKQEWDVTYLLKEALLASDKIDLIEQCLLAPARSFEAGLDFTWHSRKPNQQFIEAARNHISSRKDAATPINQSAVDYVVKHLPKKEPVEIEPNSQQMLMWRRAQQALGVLGFSVVAQDGDRPDETSKVDYHITFVDDLGVGVFAELGSRCHIQVAAECFDAGQKNFTASILTEIIRSGAREAEESLDPIEFAARHMMTLTEKILFGEST